VFAQIMEIVQTKMSVVVINTIMEIIAKHY
jgi:hypothetical protein